MTILWGALTKNIQNKLALMGRSPGLRGCIYPRNPRLLVPEHKLGDRRELHIRRAFVDLADLGVAIILLHRVVLAEAVAAKDLHRLVGNTPRHLGGDDL